MIDDHDAVERRVIAAVSARGDGGGLERNGPGARRLLKHLRRLGERLGLGLRRE